MNTSGIIRPMRLEDVPVVMEIENDVYPFPWTEGIFQDCIDVGYDCWVLENKKVIAYGVLSMGVDEAHLLNVTVAAAHQHQGIGRRMVKHFIHLARRKNAESLFLEVRPSNEYALRLYKKLGFVQVGLRKDYYPAHDDLREDALVLECDLVG